MGGRAGGVNKILAILTTGTRTLGGDVLPGLPGLTEWKYCYRGEVIKGWLGEERSGEARGDGGQFGKVSFEVSWLCISGPFEEINLIRKWSPTVASFEFQMFTMDTHYCRMLGICFRVSTKIILAMFSSSSFHGGLVANIFDSCKSSPLSCFAQSGGFLPSHYPSFLRVRVGSGWQGIFIDLDDTLCHTRLLDVCQMLELAQFCWSIITILKESIDGIVEIEMVLDPVRLWRSGHKPAENCVKIENDTKFGVIPAPAPHWPPISGQPVTMVTNCRDPNIWYKQTRPENKPARLVICLEIDCFSEVRICRRLLCSLSLMYCEVHCQW